MRMDGVEKCFTVCTISLILILTIGGVIERARGHAIESAASHVASPDGAVSSRKDMA